LQPAREQKKKKVRPVNRGTWVGTRVATNREGNQIGREGKNGKDPSDGRRRARHFTREIGAALPWRSRGKILRFKRVTHGEERLFFEIEKPHSKRNSAFPVSE